MSEQLLAGGENGEFAKSDFRRLESVVKAYRDTCHVMYDTLGEGNADDLLNAARQGSIEEPQSHDLANRPVYAELILPNNLPLAHALAERVAALVGIESTHDMVRRAAYTLSDMWNGDEEILEAPNENHISYIAGTTNG